MPKRRTYGDKIAQALSTSTLKGAAQPKPGPPYRPQPQPPEGTGDPANIPRLPGGRPPPPHEPIGGHETLEDLLAALYPGRGGTNMDLLLQILSPRFR